MPLALPILVLLAFDIGSETMPSLALSRDPVRRRLAPGRPDAQAALLPYPFIVLGAEELRKWLVQRRSPHR